VIATAQQRGLDDKVKGLLGTKLAGAP
jgi:hypothetical protein